MKYKNDEYRARERGALKAAQNLAGYTCYRTFGEPAITPPQLRDALQVPQENLFLLPSGGDYPYGLEKAVQETRSALLIVEPGSAMDGSPTFYFTLLRCADGQVRWHRALRLWLRPEGELFLVPDPEDPGAEGDVFKFDRGIRLAETPWADDFDRDYGLRHASEMLLAP